MFTAPGPFEQGGRWQFTSRDLWFVKNLVARSTVVRILGVFVMSRAEAKRRRLQSLLGSAAPAISLTVEQLMTASPITVEPHTSALDLAQLFYTLHIRHFPVKDETGRLVGIVSDREMVRCFGVGREPTEEELAHVSVRQLMNTDVLAVEPHVPVLEAVRLMLRYGVSSLPVTRDGQLVGIVTSSDLFALLERLLTVAQPAAPGGAAMDASWTTPAPAPLG